MSIKKSILALKDKLLCSVKRYPLASLFAAIATLTSIFQIHYNHGSFDWIANIAFASSFGFFIIIAFYHWRRDYVTLSIGIVLVFIYWLSLQFIDNIDSIIITRFITLIAIALLLLTVLPSAQKRDSNLKFWAWVLNILLALIGSMGFGFILFGGLAGAMGAATTLFELSIRGRYYGDIFALIMGIFSTHYFLMMLAKKPQEADPDKEFYGHVGKFFVKYILTPITSIYAIILVVYLLKILLTMEWPNGILVWLSLVFASLSLATYLSWTPSKNRYKKALLIVALVQMGMMFIAIYMRISQYGWSDSRYYVVMLGIWFTLTFLYLIIKRDAKYGLPFALLAIFFFISQYGWRLSAREVSYISQTNRFLKLIKDNTNLSDTSPKKIRCNISRSLDYLISHNNKENLVKIMPKIAGKYYQSNVFAENSFARVATKELGFNYLSERDCKNKYYDQIRAKIKFVNPDRKNHLDISGYEILYPDISFGRSDAMVITRETNKQKVNMLIIKDAEKTIGEFDLSQLVENLMKIDNKIKNNQNVSQEQLTFVAQNDEVAIKVYFDLIEIHRQTREITGLQGIVLVRKE